MIAALALLLWTVAALLEPVPVFKELHKEAGLHTVIRSGGPEKRYLLESVGGGLGVIDFDNDGWSDLYLVNGNDIDGFRAGELRFSNALYHNNGDGTFSDVTAQAGVPGSGWGKGVLVFDYDGDGFDDLYVCNVGPNILYRNKGDGTFADVTDSSGLGDPRWSSAAAAADYDADGDLDVFVANYLDYHLDRLPVEGKFCFYRGIPVACGPRGLTGAPDALYRNNGDGSFSEVSTESGVDDRNGFYGLGAVWGDYDNDGDPDLYVANDSTANYLYRNEGKGRFSEVGAFAGVAYSEDGREQAGMGVDFEDYDNDGWLDLVVTNFSHDYNTIYRNRGDGSFVDASFDTGLAEDSQPDLSWGAGFVDADNDGFKDLFIASGHIYPQVDSHRIRVTYHQQSKLYRNDRRGRFVNVSEPAGLLARNSSRGAAFSDFNNDGWIDIALLNLDSAPSLLINQGLRPEQGRRHWIRVELKGRRPNPRGVGARIEVQTAAGRQVREVRAGASFASSNDQRLHFGLGGSSHVERLTVTWPSGSTSVLEHLPADQTIRVVQPELER